MKVYLLLRQPPASELLGAFSSVEKAMAGASEVVHGIEWKACECGTSGLQDLNHDGLWRIWELAVDE